MRGTLPPHLQGRDGMAALASSKVLRCDFDFSGGWLHSSRRDLRSKTPPAAHVTTRFQMIAAQPCVSQRCPKRVERTDSFPKDKVNRKRRAGRSPAEPRSEMITELQPARCGTKSRCVEWLSQPCGCLLDNVMAPLPYRTCDRLSVACLLCIVVRRACAGCGFTPEPFFLSFLRF